RGPNVTQSKPTKLPQASKQPCLCHASHPSLTMHQAQASNHVWTMSRHGPNVVPSTSSKQHATLTYHVSAWPKRGPSKQNLNPSFQSASPLNQAQSLLAQNQ
ncbi:hypothetical protein PIB30_075625, partial [Stylosanthes scabra]|nr:hypothetical protein [Stylosanthes scabra]